MLYTVYRHGEVGCRLPLNRKPLLSDVSHAPNLSAHGSMIRGGAGDGQRPVVTAQQQEARAR